MLSKLKIRDARSLIEMDFQDRKSAFTEEAIDDGFSVENMPENMRRNFIRSIAAAVLMDALDVRNAYRFGDEPELLNILNSVDSEIDEAFLAISQNMLLDDGHILNVAGIQSERITQFLRDELLLDPDKLTAPEILDVMIGVRMEFNQLRNALWPSLRS